jgi:hypothetical protein
MHLPGSKGCWSFVLRSYGCDPSFSSSVHSFWCLGIEFKVLDLSLAVDLTAIVSPPPELLDFSRIGRICKCQRLRPLRFLLQAQLLGFNLCSPS